MSSSYDPSGPSLQEHSRQCGAQAQCVTIISMMRSAQVVLVCCVVAGQALLVLVYTTRASDCWGLGASWLPLGCQLALMGSVRSQAQYLKGH